MRKSGDAVKLGKWKLAAQEVATVIEVDRDGDFRLRNQAGSGKERDSSSTVVVSYTNACLEIPVSRVRNFA